MEVVNCHVVIVGSGLAGLRAAAAAASASDKLEICAVSNVWGQNS